MSVQFPLRGTEVHIHGPHDGPEEISHCGFVSTCHTNSSPELSSTLPHSDSSTTTPRPVNILDLWDRVLSQPELPVYPALNLPSLEYPLCAALGSPDLFLLAARSGDARDRWVMMFVQHAISAGERVLVVSPHAAGLDRLVQSASQRFAADVAMRLPPGRPELPRGYNLDAVLDEVRTLEAERATLERQCACWDECMPLWQELVELSERIPAEPIAISSDSCPCPETAPPDPLPDPEQERLRSDLERLTCEIRELEPVVEARRKGRVLSPAFWRSVFAGDVVRRHSELSLQIQSIETVLCDARMPTIAAESPQGHHPHDDAASSNPEHAASRPENSDWEQRYQNLFHALDSAGLEPPQVCTSECVRAAQARASAQREYAERETQRLAHRLQELQTLREAHQQHDRMAQVPVVLGTVDLAQSVLDGTTAFDRLVILDAEQLSQETFRGLTRFANRWLLSGSHREDDKHFMNGNGTNHMTSGPDTMSIFTSLWDRFHRPSWLVEHGRLICRLHHNIVGPLVAEPCLDRPEIELRFGELADGTLVIAEIAFPEASADAAANAKAFLARELEDVRLNPHGVAVWQEFGDRLEVEWPAAGTGGLGTTVAPGVCEYMVMHAGVPVTTRVVFDPATGWDRAAAEAWIDQHTLHSRRTRTAHLPAEAMAVANAGAEACLV